VVERTVDAMRGLGATEITAAVGPCIRPGCYAFGADDLDAVAGRLGERVRARTADGSPALDLPAAVRAALDRSGVVAVDDAGVCTACSPGHFSHRARGERERQAVVVWRPR
jgi:copper oxidase (laccase) domain-containing protein